MRFKFQIVRMQMSDAENWKRKKSEYPIWLKAAIMDLRLESLSASTGLMMDPIWPLLPWKEGQENASPRRAC